VCPATPFPRELSTGPNLAVTTANKAACRFQFPGEGRKLAMCCLADPTMGELLLTVRDGANQQITTHPRRLTPVKPAPLIAELVCAEIGQCSNAARYFCMRCRESVLRGIRSVCSMSYCELRLDLRFQAPTASSPGRGRADSWVRRPQWHSLFGMHALPVLESPVENEQADCKLEVY
jgi:hypothetical protein